MVIPTLPSATRVSDGTTPRMPPDRTARAILLLVHRQGTGHRLVRVTRVVRSRGQREVASPPVRDRVPRRKAANAPISATTAGGLVSPGRAPERSSCQPRRARLRLLD